MIELFVTDIDGCLGRPYVPYDLDGLATLREYAVAAGQPGDHPTRPALTICSGRPYPYVEALTQTLRITTPVLFEAGAGQFDPVSAKTTWSPHWTDDLASTMEELRHWLVTECIPGTRLMLDHAKRTHAGVITPDEDEITELRPKVEQFVDANADGLHVFTTDNSVDIVPAGITKRHGLTWLADTLDVEMDEIAYIGDTNGDLEALAAVGTSFAPANAHEVVREQVDVVTDGRVLDGTLQAYNYCLRLNTE